MAECGTGKRLLIVGGVAGGASAAARARRLSESSEIHVFDRGPFVSFANCGLPYYVGNVIADETKLLVASPELFERRFNIRVHVNTEVMAIDRQARAIEVRDLRSGETRREPYDALVLSPGAAPIRPPIEGADLDGIHVLRTIPDSRRIREAVDGATRAVIVGGGFIGLEMAENLRRRDLDVTIVEMSNQLLPPLDPEMASLVVDRVREHGVQVRLGAGVSAFRRRSASGGRPGLIVATADGHALDTDLVILAIGVRPEAALARAAGLELGARGGIRVDGRMQTSDPYIWAVGDAVESPEVATGAQALIPLAGPANRQGRIAATNIVRGFFEGASGLVFRGIQGTAVCGAFGLVAASTGASEKSLARIGRRDVGRVYLHPGSHVGYYPGAHTIAIKLLYAKSDGTILGAQAVGEDGVVRRIDVIATALQLGGTVYDLEECELCYAPQFGAAKDPVNLAGMIAANQLRGDVELAQWEELPDDAYLLDVRTLAEREIAHIPGSHHLPIDDLRDRVDELPRDRPIWLVCAVGQRAYYSARLLMQHGIDARVLSGGMKTWAAFQAATPASPSGATAGPRRTS